MHEEIQGKVTEFTAAYPAAMCKKWAKSIMRCVEWSTWCAWAGGDNDTEFSEAVYVTKRRL
eukprot:6949535-Pyramimonas_sp.AAC.1